VRAAEPSLYRAFNPWDKITTADALCRLFARAGIEAASTQPTAGEHYLDRPEDFWDIVLGSGYRGTVDALRPEQSEAVRDQVVEQLGPDRAALARGADHGDRARPQDRVQPVEAGAAVRGRRRRRGRHGGRRARARSGIVLQSASSHAADAALRVRLQGAGHRAERPIRAHPDDDVGCDVIVAAVPSCRNDSRPDSDGRGLTPAPMPKWRPCTATLTQTLLSVRLPPAPAVGMPVAECHWRIGTRRSRGPTGGMR